MRKARRKKHLEYLQQTGQLTAAEAAELYGYLLRGEKWRRVALGVWMALLVCAGLLLVAGIASGELPLTPESVPLVVVAVVALLGIGFRLLFISLAAKARGEELVWWVLERVEQLEPDGIPNDPDATEELTGSLAEPYEYEASLTGQLAGVHAALALTGGPSPEGAHERLAALEQSLEVAHYPYEEVSLAYQGLLADCKALRRRLLTLAVAAAVLLVGGLLLGWLVQPYLGLGVCLAGLVCLGLAVVCAARLRAPRRLAALLTKHYPLLLEREGATQSNPLGTEE